MARINDHLDPTLVLDYGLKGLTFFVCLFLVILYSNVNVVSFCLLDICQVDMVI